jgi:hypothetical protein
LASICHVGVAWVSKIWQVATSFQLVIVKGPTKLVRIWMTLSFAVQVQSYNP